MIFYKEKFQQLREARGLTLAAIATALGVSQSIVSRWGLKGKGQPLPKKIPKLAEILQCKESDLVLYGPEEGATEHRKSCLQHHRERAGMTLEQLANTLGVDKFTLDSWEKRLTPYDQRYDEKLKEALHLYNDDLYDIHSESTWRPGDYVDTDWLTVALKNGASFRDFKNPVVEAFRSKATEKIIELRFAPEVQNAVIRLLLDL